MKKYMKPITEVINMTMNQGMLAASTLGFGDDPLNPGDARSRRGIILVDDEEEEW